MCCWHWRLGFEAGTVLGRASFLCIRLVGNRHADQRGLESAQSKPDKSPKRQDAPMPNEKRKPFFQGFPSASEPSVAIASSYNTRSQRNDLRPPPSMRQKKKKGISGQSDHGHVPGQLFLNASMNPQFYQPARIKCERKKTKSRDLLGDNERRTVNYRSQPTPLNNSR